MAVENDRADRDRSGWRPSRPALFGLALFGLALFGLALFGLAS
jgi:hypothetical protein